MTMTKFPFYILIRYICICGSSPFVFVNQILLYLLIATFFISQPSAFVFLEQFFLYLWPVATLATASVTEKTLLTLAGERTMPNIYLLLNDDDEEEEDNGDDDGDGTGDVLYVSSSSLSS